MTNILTENSVASSSDESATEQVVDFDDYQKRVQGLLPHNKAAVFDALSAAGIVRVVVVFDGSSDSGQVESIDGYGPDESIQIPATSIELRFAEWTSPTPEVRSMSLVDAIEELAYGFLEDTHDGWEDGDGAFGEFVFDVAARSIVLDYNDRYIASENFSHEF